MCWLWILLAFVGGTYFGMVIFSLISASNLADRKYEQLERKEGQKADRDN